MKWLLIGCCAVQVACAAGAMVIKVPVEQQCAGYGLKGCPELVDGVLLYVDGDKERAVHKLKEAVGKNSPEQLRPFAKALKDAVPGEAGAEIAMILSGEIESKAASGEKVASNAPVRPAAAPGGSAAPVAPAPEAPTAEPKPEPVRSSSAARLDTVQLALVASVDPARLTTESVAPQGDAAKSDCEVAGAQSVCIRKQAGPLVVTDAMAPSGCKTDLFIGASDYTGKLAWVAQVNAPGVHGARLFVRADQMLTFAARGVAANKEGDPRCVVTWAGFRPRMVPNNLSPAGDWGF